jgi:hypothetical protein
MMKPNSSLVLYRGPTVSFEEVRNVCARLLGGHLRPDAALVVHGSAPVRVDRSQNANPDPNAGTVRVLHFAIPRDSEGILTNLSKVLLTQRLGFPEELREAAWRHFGEVPAEALGLALSEQTGPVAVLSARDTPDRRGSYSLFSAGRRLWSASYRPGIDYATWDGNDLEIKAATEAVEPPLEGSWNDFPAHGLRLLFPDPLDLNDAEVRRLLPSLWRASRPPTEAAEGNWLVDEGRFVQSGRPLSEDDWNRFLSSF